MSIKVDNISYIYEKGTGFERQALKNVSCAIEDGEFIGLIGHTGSGKSTFIQHLNGLVKPTEGHIYYNGRDIYEQGFNMKELRSRVGLVFQYPEHQLFETEIFKDVCFGPKNLGLPKEEIEKRAKESLRLVGIDEKMFFQSPFDLSGGQKRRVAIAGVLAMKPDVLILDEPTAGLDPKGRDDILNCLKYLREETGMTIILVSHSMDDVANYVSRIMVMNDGVLTYDDTPRNVFRHYKELEAIRKRQFPFFNIDLIYGIKGQTVASFLYSLEQALLFQPNELFIYPLYVRPGTAITERESDDVCFQMYCAACDLLKDRGFLQTSMRRFIHHPSTDAEISCGDEVMLSCGSGGRSYLGNLHYATRYTVCQRCIAGEIDDYMGTTDFTVARNGFILSQEERRQRFIIKNLMYYMGLDKTEYKRRFGESPDNVTLFRQLAERQWIENTDNGRVCLTSEGMAYSDYIGQLFITPEIRELMETYSY